MGKVIPYVGVARTIVVLEPDGSLGPFVPLDIVTQIGLLLITAVTTADGRAAIQAAARGVNSDITQILGMKPVNTLDDVLTPLGIANMATLAAALQPYFPASTVITLTGSAPITPNVGVVWASSAGGEFDITAPRSLGTPTAKSFFVIKTNPEPNPINIVDDLGAIAMTLIAKNALAFVSVYNNTVNAGGTS